MAPEVVRGELYDAKCDWWSVAVILYEVSITPKYDNGYGAEKTTVSLWSYSIPCRRRR
jgi:protein-serine/threonine kinase